jgi:hypothetical protein
MGIRDHFVEVGAHAAPIDTKSQLTDGDLHRSLNGFNHLRFEPGLPSADWLLSIIRDAAFLRLEGEFVENERRKIRERAESAPRTADAFVEWFETLEETGPGQNDPLFPWLAENASDKDIRWFLEQVVAGEAGFDDLVALAQVKMPARAKLELARNYWDEMGQGDARAMHGPMLARLSAALELRPEPARVLWESLALGNLMAALGSNRRYAYQAIGALGVIELTAPGRAECVNAGLKRLGVPGDVRRYFALHATLDVKHSEAWDREVLHPLVSDRADLAVPLAEGALLRLEAGARCFRRYRQTLWQ